MEQLADQPTAVGSLVGKETSRGKSRDTSKRVWERESTGGQATGAAKATALQNVEEAGKKAPR